MSMGPRYAEHASELLARATPEATPPRAEDRALAILAIERAMRAKARRRMMSRVAIFAAVAASVALYFVANRPVKPIAVAPPALAAVAEVVSGEAVAVRGSVEQPLSSSVPVTAGDRIIARPASHARIKLSTGTTLLVEDEGDLAIVEQTSNQVFSLGSGSMRADVAKLAAGQRFVVRTPDAEFEARGTSFRVARIRDAAACANGLVTKLSVYEGLVAARAGNREVSVGAGQDWMASCEPRAKRPDAPAAMTAAPEPSAAQHVAAAPSARGLQPMNDLFAEAMDAKARGDKAHALSALQRLETQYPSSPLAESATVERMKILAATNPKAAALVAKRYMATYPDGFARKIAEDILKSQSP
jgi:hypothetical protein